MIRLSPMFSSVGTFRQTMAAAKSIADRLERQWRLWSSHHQRLLLLDAAETVANAHATRLDWERGSKAKRRWYERYRLLSQGRAIE